MCPISPARWCAPRSGWPSRTTAPPTPVPTATIRTLSIPAAAPTHASPAAWASTSFCTITGTGPSRGCRRRRRPSATSVPTQPVRASVAEMIVPRSTSTTPAVPMPTAAGAGPPWLSTSVTTVATASRIASGPAAAGVGVLATGPVSPLASTSAAPVVVPPRSIPSTRDAGAGVIIGCPFSSALAAGGIPRCGRRRLVQVDLQAAFGHRHRCARLIAVALPGPGVLPDRVPVQVQAGVLRVGQPDLHGSGGAVQYHQGVAAGIGPAEHLQHPDLRVVPGVQAHRFAASVEPGDRRDGFAALVPEAAEPRGPQHPVLPAQGQQVGHGGAQVLLPVFQLPVQPHGLDRKSTRLNSSHVAISYAVFCLKKKKRIQRSEHDQQSKPHPE